MLRTNLDFLSEIDSFQDLRDLGNYRFLTKVKFRFVRNTSKTTRKCSFQCQFLGGHFCKNLPNVDYLCVHTSPAFRLRIACVIRLGIKVADTLINECCCTCI